MRILVLVAVLGAAAAGEEWRYPRCDLQNTGVTRNRGPEKEPRILWRREEAGPIGTGAALAEGKLVYNCGEFSMGCRLQNSGFEVWNFAVKQQVVSWPVLLHDMAYFGGQDTVHYGIRMATLEEPCSTEAKAAIVAPPAVTEDHYLAGALDGVFYAMSARDGRVFWQRETGPVRHSAAVVKDRVYVVNENGVLYSFDLKRGTELWKRNTGARPLAAPLADKTTVYLVVPDRVLALDAKRGEERGAQDTPGISCAPALEKTQLYYGTSGGELVGVDLKTGKELGRVRVAEEPVTTPLVRARDLLYGAAQARLFAATTKGWKVLWTRDGDTVWQPPIVADRMLFAGAGTVFYAFQ